MTPQHESLSSLEQLGWRQCSIIEGRDMPSLSEFVANYADDDIYIVLPYSCAVVQMDFDKEPNIELFRVRKVDGRDRGLQYGRNPRLLQLVMEDNGARIYVNGPIHDRFFIEHQLFLDSVPNSRFKLSDEQCAVTKSWFAKRYIRNAFPSEFNKRAGSALRALQGVLKSSADIDDLLGVYIELDPCDQELVEADDVYEVDAYFLVKELARVSGSLNAIKTDFESTLSACEGISVSGVEIRSETDMLLSEFRRVVRIDDYDFISFRDNQDNPEIG